MVRLDGPADEGAATFPADPNHTGAVTLLRLGNKQTTPAIPADGTTAESEW